jgi:hypothetical protein
MTPPTGSVARRGSTDRSGTFPRAATTAQGPLDAPKGWPRIANNKTSAEGSVVPLANVPDMSGGTRLVLDDSGLIIIHVNCGTLHYVNDNRRSVETPHTALSRLVSVLFEHV